ncbi:CsbD family protein [Actinocorallia aurantiaca]|uniref:CsbD-like protein n=1 Tax=Actinocorallia aurantiaca TaxID=46204 RepID=A0ABP6GHI7_9ACTN
MGFFDKLRNKATIGKGHAKENLGRDTRDPGLAAEGQADRLRGGAKQVGERVKDAARDIRRSTR